jgi:mannitol-1-phosphate/altronate dehydrogenase
MLEMNLTITKLFNVDQGFADWYSQKELSRFSNKLLYDPISRVAREPFRKLGLEDRLVGAAQLALSAGVIPKFLILGIMAAFLYDNKNDDDHHIQVLLNSLSKEQFLSIIIQIQSHEALYKIMMKYWDESLSTLTQIKDNG